MFSWYDWNTHLSNVFHSSSENNKQTPFNNCLCVLNLTLFYHLFVINLLFCFTWCWSILLCHRSHLFMGNVSLFILQFSMCVFLCECEGNPLISFLWHFIEVSRNKTKRVPYRLHYFFLMFFFSSSSCLMIKIYLYVYQTSFHRK